MPNKLNTAISQIRRTPYQSLGAIMVMFFTLFTISCFTLISLGSIKILKYFEAAPQVVAFFEKGKDLSEEEIAKIKSNLDTSGKLASFKYVSTHEAEAIYKEKTKDDPLLLELVNYKILPPSIEISATNIESLTKLKDILAKQPGVQDIGYYEDVVKSLTSWIKNIRLFGLLLIIFLMVQSIVIIITITGMKILIRKEEIEILKLLGASNWFIRWPFLVEGAIYGLIGSFLGWGLSYVLILYATPTLVYWLGDINLLPVPILIMLAILLVNSILGMLIGVIGSLLAVHRFLRR